MKDQEIELEELKRMYNDLKDKHRKLEKEYKNLQLEHSRLLFDMVAVIEHEVKIKFKRIKKLSK